MSRTLSRVFLQTNSELRAFFWFSLGSDGSLYFSSSNTKHYRRGFHGSGFAPLEGAHIRPERDGRPLSREEIDNYHSLHRSGIFSLPTMSDDRRDRHTVTHLEKYVGPIPLVGVLLMEPSKYPVTSKAIKPSSDLVIDISALLAQPFALMFYVKRKTESHPPVSERREEWPIYCRMQTSLESYDLCVIVYANPATFRSWQELEVTVTSRPEMVGGDLAWPIFGST
jgi:hypothetical protein